jgi:hypothetical protein
VLNRPWRAWAAAAALYVAITAVFGRHLLAELTTVIAGDEGDPLFVAAILDWNARHLPLTDAWWQFPIFTPTRDALTFSEPFLGVTPLSTPLRWITGSAVVTYNLVALLTFPLCGLTMFALVRRLTGSRIAAFLAGLAFAFAPYRIAQIPHLQMLAFFWAPLVFLGLHAFLDTGRRRWLALYAVAWMLQGASNLYAMVFLSVLVGFWVLWFVVGRRRWPALAEISAATAIAGLALAPMVVKYLSVHALHGFTRDAWEVRSYAADLAAVLCAPPNLTFWGWLQVACRPEGQLFPGVAGGALIVAAAVRAALARREEASLARALTLTSRTLLVAACAFAGAAVSVALAGPWRIDLGLVRVSASSAAKPATLSVAALILGLILTPSARRSVARSSTAGFYAAGALLTWLLALGPVVTLMGVPRAIDGPFALLMDLPGGGGLRVPARFFLLTTLCLGVLIGFAAAALLERRQRIVRGVVAPFAAVLILSDGWIGRFPAGPLPASVPDGPALQGATVIHLPMGFLRDIAAEFLGATGGWKVVNGYSGYQPAYYAALLDAAREEEEATLVPFQAYGPLHAVVAEDAPRLIALVESQPGAQRLGRARGFVQYRLPRRAAAVSPTAGPLPIASLQASCESGIARRAADGDERTVWGCGPQFTGQEMLADLGRPSTVSVVVQNFGASVTSYPRHLVIETSVDGETWQPAFDGSIRTLLISQALERPGTGLQLAVPFTPRVARHVRLRQTAATDAWSIGELEIRGR